MRYIETIKGQGTAMAPDGRAQTVAYELEVYQNEINVGSMTNPNPTIPGMKRIEGHVSPPCFFGQNGILLHMQDGRKMNFATINMQGKIAFGGWAE